MNNGDSTVEDLRMYRPPQREEPQVQLDEILQKMKTSFNIPGIKGGGSPFVIGLAALVILIVWLANGFYTVSPDQQAALRTFGKFQSIQDQGFHWHWPRPIGKRDVISVTTLRQLELGFRAGVNRETIGRTIEVESLMITGDINIVDVQAVVQYRIGNLRHFLFEVDDPGDVDRSIEAGSPDGRTLRDIGETALRQVVGARNIDDVLTTEKESVQADVLLKMRELTKAYKTGIDIDTVLLQNVNPPQEVQEAFEDVVKAREDKETLINLAEAYKADQIPRAEGRAAQIVEEAQGFKDGRIAKAQGEADGFIALVEGYNQSKVVTRKRLYLEAMEQILPSLKKFILSNDGGVLPFLPLAQNSSDSSATIKGGGQ